MKRLLSQNPYFEAVHESPLTLEMELYLLILCLCSLCIIRSDPQARVVSVEEFPAYEAYNEGVSLTRINQRDAAIAAYLRAVSLKPDLAEAHQNLGVLCIRKQRRP